MGDSSHPSAFIMSLVAGSKGRGWAVSVSGLDGSGATGADRSVRSLASAPAGAVKPASEVSAPGGWAGEDRGSGACASASEFTPRHAMTVKICTLRTQPTLGPVPVPGEHQHDPGQQIITQYLEETCRHSPPNLQLLT